MTSGRPMGTRNWDREPYRDTPALNATGRVKLSTNVEQSTRHLFHSAARTLGVSLAYLFEQIGEQLHVDEKAGTVTVAGSVLPSPTDDQEALVILA